MRVEAPGKLLLGLGTGVAFGTLLQKGRVGKYEVIVDQLLLRDGTVAKVMGTAMVVGAVGVQILVQTGHAALDVKPLRVGSILAGAVLFGSGLAVIGYCPGTTLAAVGEGRRDAIAGVLGMLAGAALFVRAYPTIKPALEAGDRGKVTLPKATRTSPWPWIGGMAAVLGIAVAIGSRR
ncbi:MAG: YeeE/YedE family protein [Deltaproteobacteria bacterium]|nr:YeeE/YedE family protein [Deltaproteobacteria bacterium]